MVGYIYSTGKKFGRWYLGGVLGIYAQDIRAFHANDIATFGIAVGNQMEFMPVGGAEASYRINLSKMSYLKIHDTTTPFNSTAYLSFTGLF